MRRMTTWFVRFVSATSLAVMVGGCALETAGRQDRPAPPTAPRPTASTREVDPRQGERLQRVMIPLIQKMNRPLPLKQVSVGILDSNEINAANAGGGEFYVTLGLLERANDEQLRGVMAHEIAHGDLGHVAKTQALGLGLNIGIIVLDQIVPGSRSITPLAGELITRAYTRKEEYEADSHGATILSRAGHNGRQVMVDTLTWLERTSGPSRGGFFSTHPGTGDRIEAIREGR